MKIRVAAICLALAACGPKKPEANDAKKFMDDAEQKLLVLGVESSRGDWIKSTYITDDTEIISAKLDQRSTDASVDYAKQSTKFDGTAIDPVTARKIKLLRTSFSLATPSDPKESEELTRLV